MDSLFLLVALMIFTAISIFVNRKTKKNNRTANPYKQKWDEMRETADGGVYCQDRHEWQSHSHHLGDGQSHDSDGFDGGGFDGDGFDGGGADGGGHC